MQRYSVDQRGLPVVWVSPPAHDLDQQRPQEQRGVRPWLGPTTDPLHGNRTGCIALGPENQASRLTTTICDSSRLLWRWARTLGGQPPSSITVFERVRMQAVVARSQVLGQRPVFYCAGPLAAHAIWTWAMSVMRSNAAAGCPWRLLPIDGPSVSTVVHPLDHLRQRASEARSTQRRPHAARVVNGRTAASTIGGIER